MLAFGKTLFGLFQVPYHLLEYGRGWLFEGGDYAGAVFLALTLIMGGTLALASGRAVARTWRPLWQAIAYMLPLTAMVRFLHFALFQAQLNSLLYYVSHTAVIMAFALLGYRITRTQQMTQKYPWLYEKAGALSWRQKPN